MKIGQGYGPSALIPGSQKSPGSEKTPPRRQPENFSATVSTFSSYDPPKTPSPRFIPGGSTGHYLEGDVRTGNRRIFWVLRETHFPWSVLEGKTGFRLLSSRNDQRRRRHGPEDPILIYFQKIVNFPPKVNLSPRLYSHPLPSESCTSYSKQPPLHAR